MEEIHLGSLDTLPRAFITPRGSAEHGGAEPARLPAHITSLPRGGAGGDAGRDARSRASAPSWWPRVARAASPCEGRAGPAPGWGAAGTLPPSSSQGAQPGSALRHGQGSGRRDPPRRCRRRGGTLGPASRNGKSDGAVKRSKIIIGSSQLGLPARRFLFKAG